MTDPTSTGPATGPGADLTSDRPDPVQEYRTAWDRVHGHAVAALTEAARLRYPTNPTQGVAGTSYAADTLDVAAFLAGVLAAVAANLGSTDRLLAGRPGSWEADLVRQVVAGTVGHDDEWLYEHRTEPVLVPLNVLDLLWQHPGLLPDLDAALTAVDERHAALPDLEHDPDVQAADERSVVDTHTATYRRFADRFTAAVQAAAAQIPGLRVPVTVDAVHDPRPLYLGDTAVPDLTAEQLEEQRHRHATTRNPEDLDDTDDLLVGRLWGAAFAAVSGQAAATDPPS